MNMGEEVSHLKAHVNTFYNNGALQRASEQPHLKTNQKPSQINKKVGSQEDRAHDRVCRVDQRGKAGEIIEMEPELAEHGAPRSQEPVSEGHALLKHRGGDVPVRLEGNQPEAVAIDFCKAQCGAGCGGGAEVFLKGS
ncbi:hypothetical protein [Ruegeria sp.]|uniref:hypothetical protein n=1 Tax=Ruegeria sp. TaxID=1879320 RepID=UPI003AFF6EB2